MELKNIDKTLYRKRLNVVIVSFILGFGISSVLFGTLLISLFAATDVHLVADSVAGEGKSNFKLNLIGVVLGLILSTLVLHRLRNHPYFDEIYYVWQIKQIQNLIYRKLSKIKQSANDGDVNAMIVLNFYFESLKQIYKLDDNTITLSTVEKEHQHYQMMFEERNIVISTSQFTKSMLNEF